jgi:AbrB family looped-hinge helix DNA binding protein
MARHVPVVRLSSKGQIVVPAPLRRKLGLRPGQALAVRAGNGREVVFVPLEEQAADADEMLRRIRAAGAKLGRDLVEEPIAAGRPSASESARGMTVGVIDAGIAI